MEFNNQLDCYQVLKNDPFSEQSGRVVSESCFPLSISLICIRVIIWGWTKAPSASSFPQRHYLTHHININGLNSCIICLQPPFWWRWIACVQRQSAFQFVSPPPTTSRMKLNSADMCTPHTRERVGWIIRYVFHKESGDTFWTSPEARGSDRVQIIQTRVHPTSIVTWYPNNSV